MKYHVFLFFLLVAPALYAVPLDLNGFQRPDGAITSGYNANYVDPYFATASLIIAKESGLNIQKPAAAWITWAVEKQKADGLFERYQYSIDGKWQAVARADADDALLALWIELIYSYGNHKSIPASWKQSIAKAEIQLDNLLDKNTGIYYISTQLPVGLLMDNTEIYKSFLKIAEYSQKQGLYRNARLYNQKAEILHKNILNVFVIPSAHEDNFLVSTQAPNGNKFYPDKAVQLYPVLYHIIDNESSETLYKNWMNNHRDEWLRQSREDYPWGLFAVLAASRNDLRNAVCWKHTAEPMRYSPNWNVLEEASLQSVNYYLTYICHYDEHFINCSGSNG